MRLVKAYKIFYGARLVVKPTEFSSQDKSAKQRKEFLSELIKDVEYRRLTLLQKRRKAREKKKIDETRREIGQNVDQSLARPIKETLTSDEIEVIGNFRESKVQVPIFEKAYEVEPVVAARVNIDDTLIIPIAPDGQKYEKQIVDKMVTSPILGRYHLAILDINLFPEAYIEMTEENYTDSYAKAAVLLLPSLLDYFEETKKSSRLYILRIKFLNSWGEEEDYNAHAISYFRKELSKGSQLAALFDETFKMLFGPRNKYDKTTKNRLRAKYLEGEKRIYITGATLEATEMK